MWHGSKIALYEIFFLLLAYYVDIPTPKGEKTGGGLQKTLRLSKKIGDFAKTSPDLIIQSIHR